MESYLIAGGSKGIGFSLALALNKNKKRVYVLSRDRGKLASYPDIYHIESDLMDFDKALPEIEKPLNGIIYCLGSITLKPFAQTTLAHFEEDYKLNVLGAVRFIKNYLPNLKKAENASIVLFSSIVAQYGMNYHASIGTAKGAIEGLTHNLAAELSPNIRVNCIAPSLVETPLSERLINSDTKKSGAAERHPLKKFGQPHDAANLAEYLLTTKSGWVTGQVFRLDGGLSTIR